MSGRSAKRLLGYGFLLAIIWAVSAPKSGAQSELKNLHIGGSLQLIRPDVFSEHPLFRFTLMVTDETGSAVKIPSQGALQKQLKIIETSPEQKVYEPFFAVAQGSGEAAVPPRYALVVFDISGSMNEKMGDKTKFLAAKSAAQNILRYFETNIDHVAIVPFESHNVVSGIRKARFVADPQLAAGQIGDLPEPKRNANTGLFTAVLTGLEVLGSQDSRSSRILIVMTDGENDVQKQRGDDSDLIEGSDVPQQVIDQIRAKQLPIYTIGFGDPADINESALRKLAAPDESKYIPARDEQALERAFKIIRSGMINNIQCVIAPDETSFDELNAANRVFKVQLAMSSGQMLESSEPSPFVYQAPLTGVATTPNIATREELDAYSAKSPVQVREKTGLPPYIPFLAYAALIAILWLVVPRFLWPEYAASQKSFAAAPKAASAARRYAPRQAGATGWRTQTGQTGRTLGGRLGGPPRTNVGPNSTSSGTPPEQR